MVVSNLEEWRDKASKVHERGVVGEEDTSTSPASHIQAFRWTSKLGTAFRRLRSSSPSSLGAVRRADASTAELRGSGDASNVLKLPLRTGDGTDHRYVVCGMTLGDIEIRRALSGDATVDCRGERSAVRYQHRRRR